MRALTLLLALLASTGLVAQSLDDFLSAPHVSGLTASESGRIAWIQNDRGVRNLWYADPPAFAPIAGTHFEADNGITMSGLQLSKDGSFAVFSRGDGPNRRGAFPNPSNMTEAPAPTIHRLELREGAEPIEVTAGSGMVLNDAQNAVLFRRGSELVTAHLEAEASAERLLTVQGSIGGIAPEPNGSRVAFSVARSNHELLAVFDPETEKLEYLAPDVYRDRNPVWSPDGEWLAFYRHLEKSDDPAYRIFGNVNENFGVWIVRPDGTDLTKLWEAPADPDKGMPSVSGSRPLRWMDDETLTFPAELDGWLHMYRVSTSGNDLTDLTPGECIVEDTAYLAGSAWLYYNNNCADAHSRVVSRVDWKTGAIETVTTGSHRVHWGMVPLADDRLAFVSADWKTPGRVTISADGQTSPVSILPENWDSSLFVQPENVALTAADGFVSYGQVFRPQSTADDLPAVIFSHGGSRRQMFPAFHYSGYYHNSYAFNQYLASQGYVVLSLNFRSGIGYGQDFRQPESFGWQGSSEYLDLETAGHYLQEDAQVNPDKIGLWGGSYGGLMTALGLSRNSEMFAAGVDIHGVHNWVETLRFWGSNLMDINKAEHAARADSLMRLAYSSSPVADIRTWKSPVLLIHGDDDRNVDVRETTELAEMLRKKGDVEFETLILPGEVHGFLRYDSWHQVFDRADRFFRKWLK